MFSFERRLNVDPDVIDPYTDKIIDYVSKEVLSNSFNLPDAHWICECTQNRFKPLTGLPQDEYRMTAPFAQRILISYREMCQTKLMGEDYLPLFLSGFGLLALYKKLFSYNEVLQRRPDRELLDELLSEQGMKALDNKKITLADLDKFTDRVQLRGHLIGVWGVA